MTPRELADKICRTLREAGHQAYLVGGCVRDLELGREPEDYDVSTDAQPERVQELFPESLGHRRAIRRDSRGRGRRGGRSGDVSLRRRLLGWPTSRSRRLFVVSARRCVPPGFHDQWTLARSCHAAKYSITSAAAPISARESFARSAIRKRDFAKTNFEWFARSAFPRASALPSSPNTLAAIKKLAPEIHAVSAERHAR